MTRYVWGSPYAARPINGDAQRVSSKQSPPQLVKSKPRPSKATLKKCPFCGEPINKGLALHLTNSVKCQKAFREACNRVASS